MADVWLGIWLAAAVVAWTGWCVYVLFGAWKTD